MAVPSAPSNPVVSEIKSTEMKVSSTHGGAGLTDRFFYIAEAGTGANGKFVDASYVSGSVFSVVIINLTPDVNYAISAGVFNSDGQSPYSESTFARTWLNYREQPAPPNPSVSSVTASSARVGTYVGGVAGRPPITRRRVRVRRSDGTGAVTKEYTDVNNPPYFTGLSRVTNYIADASVLNEVGWSDWSPTVSFETRAEIPPAPQSPVLSNPDQTSIDATFVLNDNGGSSILEWEISYGKSPDFSSDAVSLRASRIKNLDAGATHYFWSRVRNSEGWSPYSARAQATLLAGAKVKVGTAWKRAVPYIRIDGVWRVARPWSKANGVWEEAE